MASANTPDCYDSDDERAQELDTLLSIYPELQKDPADPFAAHLDLLVAPTTPLSVVFEHTNNDSPHDGYQLAHLPPLRLHLRLPAEYPADAPPTVTLSTDPSWLPCHKNDNLIKHAASLWEEYGGGQILFAYISYLQEAAEAAFDLTELVLPADMKDDLLQYNKQTEKRLFDNGTFDCGMCLEPKKGTACYRLEKCEDVFCTACLQDYYNNCIAEGIVNNVKCVSTDCSDKKARLLSPKELLQIPLALETVQRYAQLRRKKKIEADTSMVYCPRSWCQGAMRTTKYPKITDVRTMDDADWDSDPEPPASSAPPAEDLKESPAGPEKRRVGMRGMDRLAVCEDCNFAFCSVCLASWHGDFVRCEPRDSTQLAEEDQASLNFILRNTSPCPTCAVPCQKSFGCNHMTCFQCKTHFCYLCGAWLDPGMPYAHFNNPAIKGCFQRLMEMVDGDMADGDGEFGGARGAERLAEFWEQEAMRMQMEEDAAVDAAVGTGR